MKKYRKKPVVIEAVQFDGNMTASLSIWMGSRSAHETVEGILIHTLEGSMLCTKGDYIIKLETGELYPCKQDIFKASYEEVEE